jgi:hypothetical protein
MQCGACRACAVPPRGRMRRLFLSCWARSAWP